MKVNAILAVLDKSSSVFKALVLDYTSFFKSKQEQFRGRRATYVAEPDSVDEPGKRGNVPVVTTVDEKFDWFKPIASEYLEKKLSIEATNASGSSFADIIVDGKVFAQHVSSMELMALKSFLENKELNNMLSTIPVRSDAEIWATSNDDSYQDRAIYEKPTQTLVNRTTLKESYILSDPNISGINAANYKPQVATRDTLKSLGTQTVQEFSGEWNHRQRAELLKRKDVLLTAVIVALKQANDLDALKSKVNANDVLDFIIKG